MSEDKSKLQLIGEIAQANNKNLELIEEINGLHQALLDIKVLIQHYGNEEKIIDIINEILGEKENEQ